MKEVDLLPDCDTDWIDRPWAVFSTMITSVTTFRVNVTRIVSENQLDRPSQVNKLITEHKVEKFGGWAEGQIVHDFLKKVETLFSMSGLSKNKDKALILFTKYLTAEVQTQVQEYKDDFDNLKRKLVATFGDPKRILKIQMDRLAEIKAPPHGDMKAEVMFP